MSTPQDDLYFSRFPGWCPNWLRKAVEQPDCSGCGGSHGRLRSLARSLVHHISPERHPGLALHWLKTAAQRCDRVPPDDELARMIPWAIARDDSAQSESGSHNQSPTAIDIDALYEIIVRGPTRDELREMSHERCADTKDRQTARILDDWANYAGNPNPWICHGSASVFYTRRLSKMRAWAHSHQQIVPSPMRRQYGTTIDGHLSEHSLEGTGPRCILVVEFDFALVNDHRNPTRWAPLINACADASRSVLDMNAALIAHLMATASIWMIIYSGGKSLQAWRPCKDIDEQSLDQWFHGIAAPLGACGSTWCRSQFVRMPDGQRDDGRRQTVEYYNPTVLTKKTATFPNAAAAKIPPLQLDETSYANAK
jgi:hypothetical protein